jgi:hypothetical protein
MLLVSTALSGLMAGLIQTAPAPQQQTPPPASAAPVEATASDDAYDLGTVYSSGTRPRGSVDSDIPPDVTLDADQIKAYGAGNISELLTYLEPLTQSAQGRASGPPVMLVNGRRISGFREIQGIPTEAIERVDILPEEVALSYGYRADQRVVNFVLKPSFRSLTAQATGSRPMQGGRTTLSGQGNVLNIAGGARYSMDVQRERTTPLYETERDILRDPGSTPWDRTGNVTGAPYGSEIDPALSAGVGGVAVVAPVPTGTSMPGLGDFVSAYGDPRTGDLTSYRTLVGESERSLVRGTVKRDLNSTTQATVSASLENVDSRSFLGLPGVTLALPDSNGFSPFANDVQVFRFIDDPAALQRKVDTLTGNASTVLDGFLGDNWRWTLSGSYDRVETDTDTGRGLSTAPFQARLDADDPTANPFGDLTAADFVRLPNDTAHSVSSTLSGELVLNGDLYELPAGGVSSTFKVGADRFGLDSTSTRLGVVTDRDQSRDRVNAQGSVNIPIASRRREAFTALGDLSFNVNAGWEDLSDFGGLPTLGVGLNWSPIEPLSFIASYTDEQGAPTISQLNDPVISTPNTPVFDFATGQTVLVTETNGGNPNLDSDNRRVTKFGVTLRPFTETNLSINANYTRSVTEDVIAGFPAVTPDLEAALPGRFTRDLGGNLIAVDARPLNFDHAERSELRTGFNFSRAFGTPNPQAASGPGGGRRGPGGGGPVMIVGDGGGRRGGGGGGPMRMRMEPGQGMFNLSIHHTWRFVDEVVIRDGLPTLDLLDGDATGGRGGTPRQEVQAQAGVFRNGFGAFMNANWRDATRIEGGTGPDLQFSDLATVNLNVFVDLNSRESWVARFPWLKGARLNLGVQNLFDERLEVTSSAGDAPLNYQADYLDPQGRVVSLTFRKILF